MRRSRSPCSSFSSGGRDRYPPQRPDQPLSERLRFGPLVKLLSQPSIAFTVGIAAVRAFVWQGIASFLPTFLISYRGQSATYAGIVFSAYFVVQAVMKPAVGSLSDRYGRDGVIFGCLAITAIGLWLLIATLGTVTLVVAIALIGTGMGWASAVEPRFMDELSDPERNAGFGLVRTVFLILGSLGSVTVGYLADGSGWDVSFGVLILLMVIVSLVVIVNSVLDLGY